MAVKVVAAECEEDCGAIDKEVKDEKAVQVKEPLRNGRRVRRRKMIQAMAGDTKGAGTKMA